MKKRPYTYNTSFPDDIKFEYTLKVDDPIAVEFCVKGMIHKYRYRNNKEYYKISLRKLVNTIKNCAREIIDETFLKEGGKSNINMDKDDIYYVFTSFTEYKRLKQEYMEMKRAIQ